MRISPGFLGAAVGVFLSAVKPELGLTGCIVAGAVAGLLYAIWSAWSMDGTE